MLDQEDPEELLLGELMTLSAETALAEHYMESERCTLG